MIYVQGRAWLQLIDEVRAGWESTTTFTETRDLHKNILCYQAENYHPSRKRRIYKTPKPLTFKPPKLCQTNEVIHCSNPRHDHRTYTVAYHYISCCPCYPNCVSVTHQEKCQWSSISVRPKTFSGIGSCAHRIACLGGNRKSFFRR